MDPIRIVKSRTAVLPAANIDTDQIFPVRFLTTITREGLGTRLFADWQAPVSSAAHSLPSRSK